jgi:hypothetical protein
MLIVTIWEQGSHTLFHALEAVKEKTYTKSLWKRCDVHVQYRFSFFDRTRATVGRQVGMTSLFYEDTN